MFDNEPEKIDNSNKNQTNKISFVKYRNGFTHTDGQVAHTHKIVPETCFLHISWSLETIQTFYKIYQVGDNPYTFPSECLERKNSISSVQVYLIHNGCMWMFAQSPQELQLEILNRLNKWLSWNLTIYINSKLSHFPGSKTERNNFFSIFQNFI